MKRKPTAFHFSVFLLISLVIGIDLFYKAPNHREWIGDTAREILFGFLLVFMLFRISRREHFATSGLIQKLRMVGGIVLVMWGGITIHGGIFPVEIYFDLEQYGDSFWLTGFVLTMLMGTFMLLQLLKSFVYIQQGRRTSQQISTLLFFILLFSVAAFFSSVEADWDLEYNFFFGGDAMYNALYGAVIFSALIVGFQCKWMHYLNKAQKIAVAVCSVGVFLLMLQVHRNLPGVMLLYSMVLTRFFVGAMTALLVYFGMALLGVYLQLPSAGILDKRMQDIRALQTVSATIGTVYRRDQLLLTATELTLQILHAEFAWIELAEQNRFIIAATRGIDPSNVEKISCELQPLRTALCKEFNVRLINDLRRDRNTRRIADQIPCEGSLLIACLKFKDEVVGIMYAGKTQTFGFIEESRGLFQAFCNQVAVALENVRLVEVSIEREVYKEELRVAHEAQMRLLPQTLPDIPGIALEGFCLTANDIGGDFYDFVQVDENRLDLIIGDVSGKGASAAFYMAELKGMLQSLAMHYDSPGAVLARVNRFLRLHMERNMFVTLCYVIWNVEKREACIARAGHEPMLLVHHDKIACIAPAGLGLGLTDNPMFEASIEEKTVTLQSGEILFLYTDGVVELRNAEGEEFGSGRLNAMLSAHYGLSVDDMNVSIQSDLLRFCGRQARLDDMTAVILKVNAS